MRIFFMCRTFLRIIIKQLSYDEAMVQSFLLKLENGETIEIKYADKNMRFQISVTFF